MRRTLASVLAAVVLAAFQFPAHAVLTIEITKGVESGIPVAVVPFSWQGYQAPPQDIAEVIQADLVRSGRFDAIPPADFLSRPHSDKEVKFKDWRLIKAEALVVGSVRELGADRFQVQMQLFDVFKGTQLAGYRYTVAGRQMRKLAHQMADIIYEKLTGHPGAFDTRIAYVTVEGGASGRKFLLRVADSDGYGPQTILESWQPLMSPSWSADGKRLAYVSFENRRSMVFVQDVASGRRTKVASFGGINSAPAWSPDGRELALVLSRDGNPEIYRINLATKALRRLTQHHAIDTEPTWSPDGKHIVFTSDRSGGPQLYRMNADGSGVKRLTFEGGYNAGANYAHDGKSVTLVSREKGGYRIAILDLRNLALQVLTDARLDESPSFAPNGQMILYATEEQGRGVLVAISSDGRVRNLLKFQQGDVREPAWSPYGTKL